MTMRFLSRSVLTTFTTVACLALPVQALDLDTMNPEQRGIFREEVRAYLLDNPEVIMEAVAVLEGRQAEQQTQADIALVQDNKNELFNDGFSWSGGNAEGDITLVEFMDYRCGYCRRAAPEVHDLLEFDGNIRFVIKEFPILGEESLLASRFAIATQKIAGEDAYKSMHDALIAFNGSITEPALSRISNSLGLNTDAILNHMNSDEVTEVIAANHALGQQLGISGTPSFVMDNQMLRGYVPLAGMQQIAADIRAQ